jgi:hypothetical protein
MRSENLELRVVCLREDGDDVRELKPYGSNQSEQTVIKVVLLPISREERENPLLIWSTKDKNVRPCETAFEHS